MRILAISGSLRGASTNSAIVEALALIASVEIYREMGDLPHFNPDLDTDDPPAIIQRLRQEVAESSALVISSPEYAHGVPGSLKNLLDWLVGCVDFPGKRIALISSSSRGVHAEASLRETLKTMSAVIVEEASVTVPLLGKSVDGSSIAAQPELRQVLLDALGRL
jgi:chromate reductase